MRTPRAYHSVGCVIFVGKERAKDWKDAIVKRINFLKKFNLIYVVRLGNVQLGLTGREKEL